MYAVIANGGKQYKVTPGDVVELELLAGEPGKEVVFEQVLFVGGDKPVVGTPVVPGVKVIAEVVEHGKSAKVMIQKYRRRKNFYRLRGHRQSYTSVKIKEIQFS